MTGHLSQDDLADHLADGSSSEAASHLQSCPDCQRRRDQLARESTAVTQLLAAEPAPVMPAEVFARVTDALRAEQANRTEQADGAAAPAPAPAAAAAGQEPPAHPASAGTDELAAARRRRHARLAQFGRPAAAVAAAAAVVVAGGIGFSALTNGGSDGATVANGPAATATTDQGGVGGASNGDNAGPATVRVTALHKATFAHDVRALLAADTHAAPKQSRSGKPDLTRPGGGGDSGTMISPVETCTRAALRGTALAHADASKPRKVTLDGKRARLVITTGKGGHRTAVAIRGCGGKHPRIVAKAGL